MTIYIALLRGINVGGHNIIKMAELKSMFVSLGLRDVKTYIQSGNVLFETKEESEFLQKQITNEIKAVFGLSVPVVIRTASELDRIIRKCPFPADKLEEGQSVQIFFLAETLSQKGIELLHSFKSDIDEYQLEGKEIYLFFRQSIRNSKLAVHLQKIGVPGTVRNWKTVLKLDELAKAME